MNHHFLDRSDGFMISTVFSLNSRKGIKGTNDVGKSGCALFFSNERHDSIRTKHECLIDLLNRIDGDVCGLMSVVLGNLIELMNSKKKKTRARVMHGYMDWKDDIADTGLKSNKRTTLKRI